MLLSLLILLISFFVLWFASGITVLATENLSKKLHISSFLTSFFTLGLLTSLSEISIAVFSTLEKTPSISVGNLIGASSVLVLLLIPLQVIIHNGIPVNGKTDQINLPLAYFVIALPVLLILDGTMGKIDAFIMLFSYITLLFTISNKQNLVTRITDNFYHPKINVYKEASKVAAGAIAVILASKFVLDNLLFISQVVGISNFAVGLVILSLGTNIPEVTVLIQSCLLKKKSIALGDYIGSATLNTLILSILTFANNSSIKIIQGLKLNILLLPLGAILFIIFARNKKFEKREAVVMIFCYSLFLLLEFIL